MLRERNWKGSERSEAGCRWGCTEPAANLQMLSVLWAPGPGLGPVGTGMIMTQSLQCVDEPMCDVWHCFSGPRRDDCAWGRGSRGGVSWAFEDPRFGSVRGGERRRTLVRELCNDVETSLCSRGTRSR